MENDFDRWNSQKNRSLLKTILIYSRKKDGYGYAPSVSMSDLNKTALAKFSNAPC